MNNYEIHIDKFEQPFQFDKGIVEDILSKEKENNGWVKISNNLTLTLIRTSIIPEFAHCFKVNMETDAETITLGYLYWGSHNEWRSGIYFKIYNKRLYDNIHVSIEDIRKALGLSVTRLPNVDIAVDFNFNVIDKIYALFQSPDLEVILLNKVRNKEEDIPELLNLSKGSLINLSKYRGFIIKGQDSHKLELEAYDKCLEIKQKSPHKEYIKQIEGFTDIYRLEVRVNGYQLKKTLDRLELIAGDFIENIQDSSLQLSIWESIFDRILRFRQKGKRGSENIIDLLLSEKSCSPQISKKSCSPQTKVSSKVGTNPRRRYRKRFTRNDRTRL